MTIIHFNTHNKGATGKYVFQIHSLLRNNGIDSYFLIQNQFNRVYFDDHSYSINGTNNKILTKIIRYYEKFLTKIRDKNYYYFRHLNTNNYSRAQRILEILDKNDISPSLLITYWIDGFLNTKDIYIIQQKHQTKILVVPLDMEPFTGGCHYAWDCKGYMNHCGNCPALLIPNPFDISKREMNLKIKYHGIMKSNAIAVSERLFIQMKEGSIFKSSVISKILMGFDENKFRPGNKVMLRKKYTLPVDKRIFLIGATNLSEPRKGVFTLVNALNTINKELINSAMFIFIGKEFHKISKSINHLKYWKHLDYLNDESDLIQFYQLADFVINTSIEDSGPSMVNQSILCGTPIISYKMGVAEDLILDGETGYLVNLHDIDHLSQKITLAITMDYSKIRQMQKKCRNSGMKKLSTSVHAKNWLSLVNSLT